MKTLITTIFLSTFGFALFLSSPIISAAYPLYAASYEYWSFSDWDTTGDEMLTAAEFEAGVFDVWSGYDAVITPNEFQAYAYYW